MGQGGLKAKHSICPLPSKADSLTTARDFHGLNPQSGDLGFKLKYEAKVAPDSRQTLWKTGTPLNPDVP